MIRRNNDILFVIIVLLVVLTLAGLIWVNYRITSNNTTGSFFLPCWLGTRLFLMESQSPYSDQTTSAISGLYQQKYGAGNEIILLFKYPFYSIFLFAPFALIVDYHIALALWMTVLELCVISIAIFSLSICRWRLKTFGIITVLVFALLWYHTIRPLASGNTTLIVSTFVCSTLVALRAGHDGLAGFLLALSMIQPEMTALLVVLLLLWGVSNKRWILFWSFFGSLSLMIAFTSMLIPDWTWQNFKQVFIYLNSTTPETSGTVLASWIPGVGKQMGWLLSIFLAGLLLWEWRLTLGKDFRQLLWTACLTLAVTQLIGLRTSLDNYAILFPGIILVFSTWYERWGKLGVWLVFIGYITMLFGLWGLVIHTVRGGIQMEFNPILFFFAPTLILVGLYWVRRWAINPPRFVFEGLPDYG